MLVSVEAAWAQADAKLAAQKADAVKGVDEMAKLAQEMVDSVFSFGELGFQEVETSRYLTGQLEKFGFKVQRGVARDSDRVGRDVGIGQAGDRARLGHRRHSAGVAEARRRVPRPDHRGRAGTWRGPQHRHAAEHPRGGRREEDHGARQAAGHDHAVAGRRRGARRRPRRGSCARACSRTWTSCSSRTSATTSASPGALVAAPASSRCSTPSRGRRRTAPARRGADVRRSTPSS